MVGGLEEESKARIVSKSKGLVPLWPTERQYLLKWAVIRIWGNWLSRGNPVLRKRKEPEMAETYFYCLTWQSWYIEAREQKKSWYRAGEEWQLESLGFSANIWWINYPKALLVPS